MLRSMSAEGIWTVKDEPRLCLQAYDSCSTFVVVVMCHFEYRVNDRLDLDMTVQRLDAEPHKLGTAPEHEMIAIYVLASINSIRSARMCNTYCYRIFVHDNRSPL
jgi:hypothetical protein